jgi:Fur family peroxide stress response transcriptional regulator
VEKRSVSKAMQAEPSRGEAIERFRERGLKPTPQRLAIYRALVRLKDHPSPEGLYKAVRSSLPALSLGTIYKALDALEAAGLVEQVSRIGDTKRYDANLDPHHHLVCTKCRSVIDVMLPADAIPAATPSVINAGQRGFKVTGVHVQFLGICQDCVQEEK